MYVIAVMSDGRDPREIAAAPAPQGESLVDELSKAFEIVPIENAAGEETAQPAAPVTDLITTTVAETSAPPREEGVAVLNAVLRTDNTRNTKSGRIILDPVAFWSAAPSSEALPEAASSGGEAASVWRVNARRLNVRDGPSSGARVVDALDEGTLVAVIGGTEGDWVRIRIEGDGVEGFVARRYLEPGDG